jgi:hypothetical protein
MNLTRLVTTSCFFAGEGLGPDHWWRFASIVATGNG